MKKTIVALSLTLALLAGTAAAFSQEKPAAKPKPDMSKVLGTWLLEVNGGDGVISLVLALEAAGDKLAGKISEPNGMFTDAPLSAIEYDGETLVFEITVASPPDGAVKTWRTELKVGADAVEGVIANADQGLSAAVSGRREKK